MKILKNLLLASMTVLAFSCSSDDDGCSNCITDELGVTILMDWDTEDDLFELDIDNADGTNFTGSSGTASQETLTVFGYEDGTYFIQIEDYNFDSTTDGTEEVTFTITSNSDADETLTYTVDVSNIESDEEISVIELTVDGDEYSFDQIEDSI